MKSPNRKQKDSISNISI